jgi:hypothetical protein
VSQEALIERYLRGPDHLQWRVRDMSPEQLRARPVPDRWSTLEVACHVVDSDGIMADRMKRIIADDEPPLLNAEESLWVARLCCHERDIQEELALLAHIRGQMARILHHVPEGAFARRGIHNVAGPLTLAQILQTATDHLEHHARFIDEKRAALGLPRSH